MHPGIKELSMGREYRSALTAYKNLESDPPGSSYLQTLNQLELLLNSLPPLFSRTSSSAFVSKFVTKGPTTGMKIRQDKLIYAGRLWHPPFAS